MNRKVRDLLRELRARLFESGSGEDDLRTLLDALRTEGLTVYLVADTGDDAEPEAIALLPDPELETSETPAFRIDHDDLTMLRGLGIDPTRTLRRRR